MQCSYFRGRPYVRGGHVRAGSTALSRAILLPIHISKQWETPALKQVE